MAKENEYEEVESANFVQFTDIGQEVEGELIEKGKSERYGFGMYTLRNDDEQVRFHGSEQLDDLMLGVELGDSVKVKFVDKEKMPRGEMKVFKVLRKRA